MLGETLEKDNVRVQDLQRRLDQKQLTHVVFQAAQSIVDLGEDKGCRIDWGSHDIVQGLRQVCVAGTHRVLRQGTRVERSNSCLT